MALGRQIATVMVALCSFVAADPAQAQGGASEVFFGHAHTARGQAQLTGGAGTLTVSNIGSSGLDGVDVDLGELHGIVTGELLAPALPIGSSCSATAVGAIAATAGPVSRLDANVIDAGLGNPAIQIAPDFSPLGATTSSVKLFLGGSLVFSQSGLSGPGCRFPPPPRCQAGCGPGWFNPDDTCIVVRFPEGPLPVTIPGGPTLLADTLVLEPDDATLQADFVSRLELRATVAGPVPLSFTLTDEALGPFNLQNRAVGQAQQAACTDCLIVSNIGSSGEDGVSMDLGGIDELLGIDPTPFAPGDTFNAAIQIDYNPALLQTGAFCTATAIGQLAGQTGLGPISSLNGLAVAGGNVQITPDFSPVGASTSSVRLFNRGRLVFTQTGLTGPGCTFSPPPSCIGGCGARAGTLVMTLDFPGGPIPVTIPGGPSISADRLVLEPDDQTASVELVSDIELRVAGLPTFQINDQLVIGPPCVTDADCDDRDPCTADLCVGGTCQYGPIQLPVVFGIEHEDIGDAQLCLNGDGTLTVSNIGSSGKDGVSLDVGETPDFVAGGLEINPLLIAPGASCSVTALGGLNRIPAPPQTVSVLNAQEVGGEVQITPDFSPLGATTSSVQLYLGGALVFSQSGLSGPGCRFSPPPRCIGTFGRPPLTDPPSPHDIQIAIDFPAGPLPVTIPGGPTILSDRLVLAPDAATAQIDFLSDIQLRAAGVPLFTIVDEAIGIFGLANRAIDGSRLQPGGGRLKISNLGSSGCDGVSIDLGDTLDVATGQLELDPATVSLGTTCVATAVGQLGGGAPGQTVSSLTAVAIDVGGPKTQITADFSPVGSTTSTVQLFLESQLVFSQSGVSGPGCFFPPPPTCRGSCGPRPFSTDLFMAIDFPSEPLPVTIPGGPTILADRLVLSPDNQTAGVDFVSDIALRAAGIPLFTIVDEALIGVPCQGNAECDDGLFCNGAETCDALLGCQPGASPCETTARCDEANDLCLSDCTNTCLSPTQCTFDALDNTALGGATLTLNRNGQLVVSNIGSSGKDGVRQDPLPSDSTEMITGLACPNFANSIQGSQARIQMYGDVPGELISELRIDNMDGDLLEVDPSFSPVGVTLYTIQIMVGDHVVANVTDLPSALVTFPKVDFNEMDCLIDPMYHISYELTCVWPITIPGVGTFDGNVIWIIGQNPTQVATRQTRIDNLFRDTGDVEMTFQYAGPAQDPAGEVCGPSPNNDACCTSQPTAGCEDAVVCGCVCAVMPECCVVQWDAACVAAVDTLGCGGPAQPTTHVVQLVGFSFIPDDLDINVGDTVRWEWVSGVHDVESGTSGAPTGDGLFSSGPAVPPPNTFSMTFDQAFVDANPRPGDVYPYYCSIHFGLGMTGTINVGAGSACKGDCCVSNGTPGCDDKAIEACVCSTIPACCTAPWDANCVNAVEAAGCGSCSGPCAPDACAPGVTCLLDGIPNVALGGATLSQNGDCNLVVSNIGSSGQDGVRQPMPPDTTRMVSGIACPNFAASQSGAKARFLMFGDVPGELISELSVENVDGETVRAQADFSPVLVDDYTIQIMIGDHTVANLTGLTEAVMFWPRADLNEIDCSIVQGGLIHISYELTWVWPITIPGQGTFHGNVIWIYGRMPGPTVPGVQTRIDNLFANTGPVEMTFLYAGPTPDPGTCGRSAENASCCAPQLTAGCEDPAACGCVCSVAPECCVIQWDAACVALVDSLGCGTPCDAPISCLNDGQCDDGDVCTTDQCCLGECDFAPVPGCGTDPPLPAGDDTCWANEVDTGAPCASSDECGAGETCGLKNRHISVRVPDATPVAIRVKLIASGDFPGAVNLEWWVEDPVNYAEGPTGGAYAGAGLSDSCVQPALRDWSGDGAIHVWGRGIVPKATYEVTLVTAADVSDPLVVRTSPTWADVVAPFNRGIDPDFGDIGAEVDKFKSKPGSPVKARALLCDEILDPTLNVGFDQISAAVGGFKGKSYGQTCISGNAAGPQACTP